MRDSVYRIVDGVARSYEVKAEVELAGEATTLPLCEDLLEIAGDCAKDVPGVEKVMPITKKAGSEDCTILMRRVVAHGGRAAYRRREVSSRRTRCRREDHRTTQRPPLTASEAD